MEAAWERLRDDVAFANTAVAQATNDNAAPTRARLVRGIEDVTRRCREERDKAKATAEPEDLSDAALASAARFTDGMPLAPLRSLLHLTPRLVNVRGALVCGNCTKLDRARAGGHPGRGRALPRLGHHAAARPAPHREPLRQLVLRAAAVRY